MNSDWWIVNRALIISIMFFSLCLTSQAENIFDFYITNDKEINARMLFLDNLSTCTPYKYHAMPNGVYEIRGKQNRACSVRWTIVDCAFPEGVYQKFADVQKFRTMERVHRQKNGVMEELLDKNYRYLLETGNTYCQNRYPTFQ